MGQDQKNNELRAQLVCCSLGLSGENKSSTKLGQKRAAPVVGFDVHHVVADVTRVGTHRAATRDVVIRPWLGTRARLFLIIRHGLCSERFGLS